MHEGCIDVFLPPLLATEVKALKEPRECLRCEFEATCEFSECGGGLSSLPRPSARIVLNKGSALIVACFLALPAMIWLRILGR